MRWAMRYEVLVGREARAFRFWTRRQALWALGFKVAIPGVGITAWDRWTGKRVG